MLLDFTEIPSERRPNCCLACPAYWNRSDRDLTVPVFAVPVERLREAVIAVAGRQPRTQMLHLDRDAGQAEFEQRSRVLRFPDRLTAAFESLGCNRSSLAIFSRARYGYWDFGVNRRRVEYWLQAIGEALEQPDAAPAP